jgi:hypothetical protein
MHGTYVLCCSALEGRRPRQGGRPAITGQTDHDGAGNGLNYAAADAGAALGARLPRLRGAPETEGRCRPAKGLAMKQAGREECGSTWLGGQPDAESASRAAAGSQLANATAPPRSGPHFKVLHTQPAHCDPGWSRPSARAGTPPPPAPQQPRLAC